MTSRPWPPIHIRMPIHPRRWLEDRQTVKERYQEKKHDKNIT